MLKHVRHFSRLALPVMRRWRRFGRDESGVTLIEFAILALPFFTIIVAIMQTAVIFLAGQILDSAVQDTSRLIRTGRVTALNEQSFRDLMCGRLYGMFDCTNDQLRINVSVVSDFGSADVPYPMRTGSQCTAIACDWVVANNFAPGQSGQSNVVLMRVYYKWPTLMNFPGFNFQTLPDGSRLMGSARVFMNEPF